MCGHQEELFLPKPSEEVLGNVLEAMPMVSQLLVWRASWTSTVKEHRASVTQCIAAAHTRIRRRASEQTIHNNNNNNNNNYKNDSLVTPYLGRSWRCPVAWPTCPHR